MQWTDLSRVARTDEPDRLCCRWSRAATDCADRRSNGHPCLLTQLLVHRHLSALVIRHAQPHEQCNAEQLVGEGLQHIASACWLGVRKVDEHQQPAGALGDRCSAREIPGC